MLGAGFSAGKLICPRGRTYLLEEFQATQRGDSKVLINMQKHFKYRCATDEALPSGWSRSSMPAAVSLGSSESSANACQVSTSSVENDVEDLFQGLREGRNVYEATAAKVVQLEAKAAKRPPGNSAK